MAEKQRYLAAFGAVLRAYRLGKGLTQEQLSERVDVVRSFIGGMENGRKQPSLQMMMKLADALDIEPGELLNGTKNKLLNK